MFWKRYDLLRQSCYWISSFYVSDLAQEVPVPRHQSIRLHGLRILRLRAAPRTTMHVLFDHVCMSQLLRRRQIHCENKQNWSKIAKTTFSVVSRPCIYSVFSLLFPSTSSTAFGSACFLHVLKAFLPRFSLSLGELRHWTAKMWRGHWVMQSTSKRSCRGCLQRRGLQKGSHMKYYKFHVFIYEIAGSFQLHYQEHLKHWYRKEMALNISCIAAVAEVSLRASWISWNALFHCQESAGQHTKRGQSWHRELSCEMMWALKLYTTK